jgi:hypothetical protein
VLLIDRSASMGATESRTALSQRARERARAVLDALEPGDEIQVVPFDARPEPLFPNATVDHGRAAAAVQALEPRPFTTDLEAAIAQGIDLLKNRPQAQQGAVPHLRSAVGGPAAGAARLDARAAAERALLRAAGRRDAAARKPRAHRGARVRGGSGFAGGLSLAKPFGVYLAASSGGAAEVSVRSFGAAPGEVAVGVRDANGSIGRELGRAFVTLGTGEGSALVPLAELPAGAGRRSCPTTRSTPTTTAGSRAARAGARRSG